MMKIIIKKRRYDFMAHPVGRPGIWDCGYSPAEALGNMFITHIETFGNFEIEYEDE